MPEPDPATRARLERIRERHHEAPWRYADKPVDAPKPCYGCGFEHPCDTSIALAALDAAVAERDAARERETIIRSEFYREEARRCKAEWQCSQHATVVAAARVYATTPQTPEHIAARVRALDAICAAVAALPEAPD